MLLITLFTVLSHTALGLFLEGIGHDDGFFDKLLTTVPITGLGVILASLAYLPL